MLLQPFIKSRFSHTQLIMLDVIIALMPMVFAAWLAYGQLALIQIGIAVVTACLTDLLFSAILLKKYKSIWDGSAVVTALLFVFTLSPLSPWYMVSFGAFAAILFGKIVWGGLGKNTFNPALVGREFMAVFFASSLSSSSLWKTADLIQTAGVSYTWATDITAISDRLNAIVFKTNGALGEYSILAISLGGLYLLIRGRISWHIPLSLIAGLTLLLGIFNEANLQFSIAGVLLGSLFMATDMPSSPTTKLGKCYYGFMIGITAFICIKSGVRYEYMSYSILLLNGFSSPISRVFKPQVWGTSRDWKKWIEDIFVLSLLILGLSFAIVSLYQYDLIHYLIYLYIIYIIFKFNYSFSNQISNAI